MFFKNFFKKLNGVKIILASAKICPREIVEFENVQFTKISLLEL